jgi:hypothetical protein
MAFLNKQERENLLDELSKLNFKKAKHKLQRIDPKGRLAYYRNAQESGRWMTRFELAGLGTRVTLVEQFTGTVGEKITENDYEMIEIVVEPHPENRL